MYIYIYIYSRSLPCVFDSLFLCSPKPILHLIYIFIFFFFSYQSNHLTFMFYTFFYFCYADMVVLFRSKRFLLECPERVHKGEEYTRVCTSCSRKCAIRLARDRDDKTLFAFRYKPLFTQHFRWLLDWSCVFTYDVYYNIVHCNREHTHTQRVNGCILFFRKKRLCRLYWTVNQLLRFGKQLIFVPSESS